MTSLSDQECEVEKPNYFNQRSEVSDFFSGRKILITGGSGFLGALIMEKLLRSCPEIKTIYLLMRGKKQKDVQTRFNEYFNDPLFEKLKEEQKHVEKKIVLIESNMTELKLGISEENRERIKDTEVIFHSAASVRFKDPLRSIININVKGTMELLSLAQEMPNLKVFTYLSTAFSHCIYGKIEEKFYEPPLKAENIIELMEILNDDQLNFITPKLLGKYPNTYIYSKAICEDLVRRYSNGIPTCVVRPSSVLATYKDPFPGWINNIYGLTGIVFGVGIGVLHVLHCNIKLIADIIPADYVINNIIVATWDTAKKRSVLPSITDSNKDNESLLVNEENIPVYNIVTFGQNSVTWEDCFRQLNKLKSKVSCSLAIWYPFFLYSKNKYFILLFSILFHWIPAYIIDSIAYLIGKKPMLINIYKKIREFNNALNFFAFKQWEFDTDNVLTLWNKLSVVDKHKFFFNNADINWDNYFHFYVKGIQKYIIKDTGEKLKKGKILQKRLKIAHYTFIIVLSGLLLWGLYIGETEDAAGRSPWHVMSAALAPRRSAYVERASTPAVGGDRCSKSVVAGAVRAARKEREKIRGRALTRTVSFLDGYRGLICGYLLLNLVLPNE
ncbi:fatty acyl-CoA reductase wat-like isoform X2 [Vespula squamosa]|uniref:Fatty acyl-CoA reductase n=1 Tax=Vespula squamosa TaxID=30214 RepID=A0ABD1ZTS5_VESSQ